MASGSGTTETGTDTTGGEATTPQPVVLFALFEITAADGSKSYHASDANPLTTDQQNALEKYAKATLARPSFSAENARLLEERVGLTQQIQALQLQVQELQAENATLKGGGTQ